MSAHSHDHLTETKPVSFTVPFILAAVTLLVLGLFLSLCDPSHAQHDSHKAGAAHEQPGHSDASNKGVQHEESPASPAHAGTPAEGAQHH